MIRALALALGVVGFGLVACEKPPAPPAEGSPTAATPAAAGAAKPGVIKIVSSLPHTSSANAQVMTIVNGIRMALDEVNWKIGEYAIEYEPWDDASPQRSNWDPAVEAANADKAVKDPDIMVYIGTFNSGAAKVSIPTLNKAGLVMISPANTYPGLTKPGQGEANEPDVYRPSGKINYFRVVPADDLQGVAAAKWAQKMGVKSAFVLHDREVYGKGIADIFKAHCEKIGIEVAGYEGIDTKAANYKSLASKIKAKEPDLVYFGGTTQSNGGQLAKDIRQSGYAGKFMVPDGCIENAFVDSAGADNVNDTTYGTFGGKPADMLTGRGAEFYKNYKAKFNSEPEVYAVYGYEAGRAAVDAIRRAGKKDREAVRQAVAQTKDFDGTLGRWSFDENGDTTVRTMSGFVIKNGEWKFSEELDGTP